MSERRGDSGQKREADTRRDRLAEELRANLLRRKAQSKARRDTATKGGELTARAFSGAPEQLWRIDQLTDGTYRIGPKAVPDTKEPLVLSAVGSSMPTLAKFDPASDRQRWLLGAP